MQCACDYGNEKEVGEAIAAALEAGICTRAELFITSKLWNTYHAAEHVPLAMARTLADLGLGYVDLYLIHFPIALQFVPFEESYPPEWMPPGGDKMVYAKVPVSETWGAMEKLKEVGLAREIGVSNFNCQAIRDLLSYCKIAPAANQIELHPLNTQEHLVRYCAEEGIVVTGFSPLGSPSYVQIGMAEVSDACWDAAPVKAAATSHSKTAAQVLLRWGLQNHGTIVPKSTKVERMEENLAIFDFALSEEEMTAIGAMNKGRRFNDPAAFTPFMNSYCPIHQ
jgi:diketogulonate reductase-like aldo/keto reductase